MSDTEEPEPVEVSQVDRRQWAELFFLVVVTLVATYLGNIYEVGAPWLWATDACQDPATVCGVMPVGPLIVVLTVGLAKR